jgi:formyl-CoA transferase
MRVGIAIADISAGLHCALGIMTALLEREASGRGQWVQANLLQSQITLMDFQAARYLMKGEVPQQVGNDHPTSMPTSAYRTKDGHINIGASGDGMWKRLSVAIGRPELEQRPEFKDQPSRAKHRQALNAEINAALGAKTSAEWIEILNRAGVPCGPIYAMDEVFADPQVKHLGVAASVRHKTLGEIGVLNQAVKLSRTQAALVGAAPEVGEHTAELLAELGYSAEDMEALRKRKVI